MGNILIITFNDEEDNILEDIIKYVKKYDFEKNNVIVKASNILKYEGLEINIPFRKVKVAGKEIGLTNYEFEILRLLTQNPGRVFTKEQIYNQVWKTPYYGADDNVTSLIRRIRGKIEPDSKTPKYIITVRGSGYKFNDLLLRKTD